MSATIEKLIYSKEFEEKELLGRGNFGQVFRVLDKNGEEFAVKKIEVTVKDSDCDKEMKKVEREIASLKSVQSDYVVGYVKSWHESTIFYILMEKCDDNLRNILDNKAKFFDRRKEDKINIVEFFFCLQLIREITQCLDHLHREINFIHRDLKPENILISYKKNKRFIKLGDFGLAKYHQVKTSYYKMTLGAGTRNYMAPEVLHSPRYGKQADIYSFAIIIYEMFDREPYEESDFKFDYNLKGHSLQLNQMLSKMMQTKYKLRPSASDIFKELRKLDVNAKLVFDSLDFKNVDKRRKSMRDWEHFFVEFLDEKFREFHQSKYYDRKGSGGAKTIPMTELNKSVSIDNLGRNSSNGEDKSRTTSQSSRSDLMDSGEMPKTKRSKSVRDRLQTQISANQISRKTQTDLSLISDLTLLPINELISEQEPHHLVLSLQNKNYLILRNAEQTEDLTFIFEKMKMKTSVINCKTDYSPEQQIFGNSGRLNQTFDSKSLSLIGEGGFACVFKMRNLIDDKYYAIKKIEVSRNSMSVKIREVKVWAILDTENIVKFFSAWFEEEDKNGLFLFIQMELCSLSLREAQLNMDSVFSATDHAHFSLLFYIKTQLLIEILEIIDFLHTNSTKIIHRDIKPENFLIKHSSHSRFVKLSDFGLSIVHETQSQSHTQMTGTVKYMAPEVMRSSKYGTEADVYSIGVLIQEMFQFDINRSNSNYDSFSNKLYDITEFCLSLERYLRPTCSQILDEKSLWAPKIDSVWPLIENIIDIEKQYSINNEFCFYFLKEKYIFSKNR